jgi:hypothetical protein
VTVDLTTLAALVGIAGIVGGLVFAYLRLRLRVEELEVADRQSREFMAAFKDMVAASQAGVRVQQSQLIAAQNALSARQSNEQRATQVQEQDARHGRLMGWLNFGLRAYDTYRKHHPREEESDHL